jgi:hypothetical protein
MLRDRGLTARSSCRTGPTCSASCGSPTTKGSRRSVADSDEPDRRERGERLRATVHEVGALALYFLAGNEP